MKIISYASILVLGMFAGCADPSGPLPSNLPPDKTFSYIKIDIESALVAVGDSVDLKATAYALSGDTLVIPPGELRWGVSDASMLRTDQNGRIQMLKASGGDIVYPWVSWTTDGITRSDSAYLIITQNREPIASIQIRPQGDSVRTAAPASGACCGVSVIARSASGDSLGLVRAPLTVDPGISTYDVLISYMGPTGVLFGLGQYLVHVRKLGPFWLRAETIVYGTLLRDSIQMFGLYPSSTYVTLSPDRVTGEITSATNGFTETIQPCGSMTFRNDRLQPVEIIFDDPGKVSGCVPGDATGNIDSLARNATLSRKLPAGTVKWTARVKGNPSTSVTGTVITREP